MIKKVVALGIFCLGLLAGGFGSFFLEKEMSQTAVKIAPLVVVQSAAESQFGASKGGGSCGN